MRRLACLSAVLLILWGVDRRAYPATPTNSGQQTAVDTDHDGLNDDLEQAILIQFAPKFMVDRADCSEVPAEFRPEGREPIVQAENATIYGQVFPKTAVDMAESLVEVHYYHLWKKDCGRMGHALDTEHVSVVIKASDSKWKAIYWYAAAHEDTPCDASQIARAATLDAEDRGATVWISAGKHASFLNEDLCRRGCGGDFCDKMSPLAVGKVVNLGESGMPMHGASWTSSARWPLMAKMVRTDFKAATVARLESLPASDIAWVNPSKRPQQHAIAAGDSTIDALVTSHQNTDIAISTAGGNTGNALDKSYRSVKHSLGVSAHNVGKFLRHGSVDAPSH
jgi:hypothetical protein